MRVERIFVGVSLALGGSLACAQGIHRCLEKRKTVYSDKPCAESVKPEDNAVSEKEVRQPAVEIDIDHLTPRHLGYFPKQIAICTVESGGVVDEHVDTAELRKPVHRLRMRCNPCKACCSRLLTCTGVMSAQRAASSARLSRAFHLRRISSKPSSFSLRVPPAATSVATMPATARPRTTSDHHDAAGEFTHRPLLFAMQLYYPRAANN